MALGAGELANLYEAMSERLPEALFPAIALANRNGEDLALLLRLLGMSDLMPGGEELDLAPKIVLVIGESTVKEGQLRSIATKLGHDSGSFRFVLGYEKAKRFDIAVLRNSYTYKAVMVGPMPHSSVGANGSSSAIAEIENHPEIYPPLVR
ncbi:hypothetical protein [uncultured Adlercreutzia sp.]|uniref:hypothetical protein n=1 Tax=uncultured Adlercreutzia sp. TaxID=875803 RepID=UPI002590CBC4|nr:hypothetical protein [uncultured Adlercreutzia sp.]